MPASPLMSCRPFEWWLPPDPFEMLVVVGGPVPLPAVSGDDPPRAAIARPRRRHGVLRVVAPRRDGEETLEVAEGAAVLAGIRERTAGVDERQGLARLGRQVGDVDP